MKRLITVLAVAALTTALQAEETVTLPTAELKAVKAECASSECASACSKGCPIEAAMAKLPSMTFMVGKEATACSKHAAELAKKGKSDIMFVVAKKKFETEGKAMVALADATEKFVKDFTTTKQCKVSGKFTVAGKELCCNVMAGQRAELAKAAMKKVKMAYMVDGKECGCPNEAASLAKKTGKAKMFVVAGEKTQCSVSARLKLAQAQYKAAVTALVKADAPAKAEAPAAEVEVKTEDS